MGTELRVATFGDTEVTTAIGKFTCLSGPELVARVAANGGPSIKIELLRAETQSQCGGGLAMPFPSSNVDWAWSSFSFPVNNNFGELVLKPKGKSTTSGSAELFPSASTDDDITFSVKEAELSRECRYSIKKLKGAWFAPEPVQLAFTKGDKLKSDGSENEASCPKTATIPVGMRFKVSPGVEVVVV